MVVSDVAHRQCLHSFRNSIADPRKGPHRLGLCAVGAFASGYQKKGEGTRQPGTFSRRRRDRLRPRALLSPNPKARYSVGRPDG